ARMAAAAETFAARERALGEQVSDLRQAADDQRALQLAATDFARALMDEVDGLRARLRAAEQRASAAAAAAAVVEGPSDDGGGSVVAISCSDSDSSKTLASEDACVAVEDLAGLVRFGDGDCGQEVGRLRRELEDERARVRDLERELAAARAATAAFDGAPTGGEISDTDQRVDCN
ncbi:hypothetical protein HK405_011655, partial [Cladochytrium tenue]